MSTAFPPITATITNLPNVLLTAIIPECWSCDGKSYEKVIKVTEGPTSHNVKLPIGTKVYFPGSSTRYILVLDSMNYIPQNDTLQSSLLDGLFITLDAGTRVIESGGLPFSLTHELKAKLPKYCQLTIPQGTKLQGPEGLLTLPTRTTIELVPGIKPTTDTKPLNKVIDAPKEENKVPNPDHDIHEKKLNELVILIKYVLESGDGCFGKTVDESIKFFIKAYLANMLHIP